MKITRIIIAISLTLTSLYSVGADVVTGNIFVCSKPMLMGQAAAIRLMGPNKDPSKLQDDWRALAKLQAEQQKYCYYAQHVEITSEDGNKVELGGGDWCKEYEGRANGKEVYVAIGSKNKQWGKCP